ncbi:zinc-binding alcohol dehydrogenase family protein [Luteimonas sp. RC10]|uniref:quinone oxidoreductase family protein n=1 Tax=Luteimonas sp. RC10 TaxID=2587035 RepID=UPI00161CD8B3|nr:zinc-binding alcohol dehydrogenase family protein [Luteimonas sp. RC10]MBB3343730.1 NADPH:quinone reductase-like Zn-dependent oxidoreductase [Luteimonas sp. RC10]
MTLETLASPSIQGSLCAWSPAQAEQETMQAIACAPGPRGSWMPVETPIPLPGPDQVLIRVLSAGFGHWDILERDGHLPGAKLRTPGPWIGGAEGAGTVVEVGTGVQRLREGDRVCGLALPGAPRHGFHAQFALVDADRVWRIPARLPLPHAAALPVDGGLAMHAVAQVLGLGAGDTLVLLGASGGIGHMALQFARQRGARVLAVVSGADGIALAERLGADMAIDGRRHDLAAALRIFAPERPTAALLTASDAALARRVVDALQPGGRIAWPHGVTPPPARADIAATGFGAHAGATSVQAACRAIERGPFHLHVGARLPLSRIADAERALNAHHLGRVVLDIP